MPSTTGCTQRSRRSKSFSRRPGEAYLRTASAASRAG
jgi:hypothetical protein